MKSGVLPLLRGCFFNSDFSSSVCTEWEHLLTGWLLKSQWQTNEDWHMSTVIRVGVCAQMFLTAVAASEHKWEKSVCFSALLRSWVTLLECFHIWEIKFCFGRCMHTCVQTVGVLVLLQVLMLYKVLLFLTSAVLTAGVSLFLLYCMLMTAGKDG